MVMVMLCAISTRARARERTQRGRKTVEIPLTHELPSALRTCTIDHAALSSKTGFQVRPPLATDRPWRVRVVAAGERLTVTLHRPDGAAVSSKPLAADHRSCQALFELVAVLLSAYVPEVVLSAPPEAASRPAPTSMPSQPPSSRASPAPTAREDPETPPALTAAASPSRPETRHWYVGAGGGVTGFSEGPAGLAMLRGHLQLWRHLALGAQALASYHKQEVAGGEASIWAVDGRLTAAFLLRRQRLVWSAGGLVGARFTHAATTGLFRDSSGNVGAVGLGLCGDVWWAAGRHLRLGLGTNVVFLLPRAAFEVTGVGQVYMTPLPSVEIHLSAGWEG
jgi:hypothetical protein